ncbi:hypothetical protein HanRHA438_Chr12g0535511 [Helianthus annuus]|nr:hypothetical protein HanIR_Chr12g0564381 [Helianthus annuus]KAJ0864964.1 hypothetical protein HanRHA438_Chr12g0535511 [Helianthus annuus]
MLRSIMLSFPLINPARAASSGLSGNPKAAPPSMERNSCTFHVSWSCGSMTGDGGMMIRSRSRTSLSKSFPPCFNHRCSKLKRTSHAIGPSSLQWMSCHGSRGPPLWIEAFGKFGWWKSSWWMESRVRKMGWNGVSYRPLQRSIPPMKLTILRFSWLPLGNALSTTTIFWWWVSIMEISMFWTKLRPSSGLRGHRTQLTSEPRK